MAEKKEGCIKRGCGTIAAIFIILVAIGFISSLFSDAEEIDTASQTQSTRTTTQTVTPQTSEEEPVKPQPQEEDPVEPEPVVVEPTQPESEESTEEPQQPEGKALEPPPEVESIRLTKTIQEAPQSNELIERHFTWEYYGEWNWDAFIPEALYDYYHNLPRPPTADYSVYVTHPLDDLYIERLVETIEEAAAQEGFDKYQTVEFAISFVQSLPYTVDSVTSPYDEYPRYPVETLVDGGGDCEDTSILLASILSEMGYGVVLISPPGHMAVGLKGGDNILGTYWEYKGDKYYYIETTGFGRKIGELPEEYAGATASIFPLNPTPIITHEWSFEGEGNYVVLRVKVSNLGTATAFDLSVFAGFDAGDDKVWSAKQSNLFELEPGHEVTATLYLLPPPLGVHTRMAVQIMMGEYAIEESYSDWFDY